MDISLMRLKALLIVWAVKVLRWHRHDTSRHLKGTMKTHRLHITLSAAQYDWLDSNSDGLTPKAVTIRGLIDSAERLDTGSRVRAYCVGAGYTSNSRIFTCKGFKSSATFAG